MASIKYYVNGAGGTSGAELATLKPLYMSGVIWYVCSTDAAASDSNAGTDRDLPLATLQQAVTNAGDGDIIDMLAGHSETISTTVNITQDGLSLIGEGAGSTLPRLTNNVPTGTGPMISVTSASGILFDSIYFPGSAQDARERIQTVGGATPGRAIFKNLVFECSANDGQRSLWLDAAGPDTVYGCTFTATGVDAGVGLQITNNTGTTVDFCTFDAGSFNWEIAAVELDSSATVGFRMLRTSLLNGSNILITPTGCVGIIQVSNQSDNSMIDWTP